MEVKHELYSLRGTGNYRGVLITKIIGGWELWGVKCANTETIDQMIDDAHKSIEASIERGKSITVSCLNGYNGCFNDKVVG